MNADPERADDMLLQALSGAEGEISRWPGDAEFTDFLRTREVYGTVSQPRLVKALAAVEVSLYTSKTDVPVLADGLSLEHLLPQEWQANWPLTGNDGTAPGGKQWSRPPPSAGHA
jgi:hypothetical protein